MLNRQGADQWVPATIVAVPVIAACAWLALRGEPGWWVPVAIVTIAWLAFLAFFRDPPRHAPASADGCLLAPADGLVSAVSEHTHHDAIGGPALVIRIFLSVLDVHVNRVPWSGRVVSCVHRPGRHLDVRVEESARVNESLLVTIDAPEGFRYAVRLVAGAVARRIACTARTGDTLRRGDRMGMIKFGSTTELVVPSAPGRSSLVSVGDRVRGGVTPLVRWKA